MKNTANRIWKSCVSMLLVCCMVLSLPLSVMAATKPSTAVKATENAFAASTDMDVNGDGKVTVVSFGDSVTNGYGLPGYMYDDGINPYGFLREVEGSYPDQIRDALVAQGYTVDLDQMAVSGYRMDEYWWALDDNYIPDDYHTKHYAHWNMKILYSYWKRYQQDSTDENAKRMMEALTAYEQANGVKYDFDHTYHQNNVENNRPIADRVVQLEVRKSVENADVITLCLGSNNFGTFVTQKMAIGMGMTGFTDFKVDFAHFMDEKSAEALEMMMQTMVEGMVGKDNPKMTEMTYSMMECLIYGYLSFTKSYDGTIKKIYEMNPDAKVVVIDMYAMISGVDMLSAKLGDGIDLDGIYNLFVDASNLYTRELSPYAHKVTHVTLPEDPELCIDYYLDYSENKEAGKNQDTQYLDTVGYNLMNDFVMEMMYGDAELDPSVRQKFYGEGGALSQIKEMDSTVNNVQNVVKDDVVVKEIVPGIYDEIFVKNKVDESVTTALQAMELLNLAIDAIGRMDETAASKENPVQNPGLIVTAYMGVTMAKMMLGPNATKDAIIDYLMQSYPDAISSREMGEMAYEAALAYDKAFAETSNGAEGIKAALAAVLKMQSPDTSDEEAEKTAKLGYDAVTLYNDTWLAKWQETGDATAADEAAMVTAMQYFLKESGKDEALAQQVYNINMAYNANKDAGEEAAMDAAIVTAMKTAGFTEEGLAEAVYAVAKSKKDGDATGAQYATAEQHKQACVYALATKTLKDTASGEARNVTVEEATAIYNCYEGGYDGKYDDETVLTALAVLMVLDERFTNLEDANKSFDSYLTYKRLPATLEKIAGLKVMYLDKMLGRTSGTTDNLVGGMAEKFTAGTLVLDEPKFQEPGHENETEEEFAARMDEHQSDVTLSVMYFRFLALDGVFTHPSLDGAGYIASLATETMKKLLVAEEDSEINVTRDSKMLVLGDFISTDEGYVNTLAKNLQLKDENVTNLSNPQFRVNEVRALLDSTYARDAYAQAMLAGIDSETYVNAVKDSDLIVVQLGSMNMGMIMEQLYAALESNDKIYSMRYGSIGAMGVRDLGNRSDRVMDRLQGMVQGENSDTTSAAMMLIFKTYNYGVVTFADCLDATVEKIQELNPNASIVLVGQYDLLGTYNTAELTDGQIHLEFGEFIDEAQRRMNDQMKIYAEMTDNVTFVDVYTNYAEYGDMMGDTNAFQRVPDAAGYAEMVGKISCHLGSHTAASAEKITWGEWVKTDDGYTRTAEYDCKFCGAHEKMDALITSAVTMGSCVEGGIKTYTAYVPTYTTQTEEAIPGGEHTPGEAVEENIVASTCTKAGSCDEVVYCASCGEKLSSTSKILELAPHTAGKTVKEKEVAATCDKDGSYDEVTYCAVCEDGEYSRVTKTVPKTGSHNPSQPVRENVKAATCTAEGSYDEVTRCTVCHAELTSVKKTLNKLEHTPAKAVREKEVPATCAKTGSYDEVVYCSVCKAELSRTAKTIDKLTTHNPGTPVKQNEVPATCAKAGSYDEVTFCSDCEKELNRESKTIAKHNTHTPVVIPGTAATCTTSGISDGSKCSVCGGTLKVQMYVPATGHTAQTLEAVEATCTTAGMTEGSQCAVCKLVMKSQRIVPAKGHNFVDGVCTVCKEDQNKPTEPVKPEIPAVEGVKRTYGENRYDTSFKVADELKTYLGVAKFKAVIVASGRQFADALAGSYLANQKGAPILLVNNNNPASFTDAKNYIAANLEQNGTVYVLGGTAAVSGDLETVLKGYKVERLAGDNRYGTNLSILNAAGVSGNEILICTGKSFADSLSASAVNKPILLVNNKSLMAEQKEFLKKNPGKTLIIIGGESAVSKEMATELSAYGKVERVSGANRYETSVAVADKFFKNPEAMVLAYAKKYPDGLCGGPLAYALNAPLILTAPKVETAAAGYAAANKIDDGFVLGGEGLIGQQSANLIFNIR